MTGTLSHVHNYALLHGSNSKMHMLKLLLSSDDHKIQSRVHTVAVVISMSM